MKYSYRLLKELSGTKKSAAQVARLLMVHAFEVEGIEKFAHGIEGVVIGKVETLAQHPNADRLKVAQVEVGKDDIRTIVCGAPNIAEGQKVAVALPGAKLPGGVEIKETVLRGVTSQGMICGADELGLAVEHRGILVLPPDAPVGASFVKFVGLDDTVIEVKILPDRGSDALAYQGLAREIAALDGHAPHFGEKALKPVRYPSYNRVPKITVMDKGGCLRYGMLSLQGIKVEESPLWLRVRLLVSGLRPINNIVDVTNYLMLLTGQPMHAFDADQVRGAIIIRRAKKNEKLTLLNGETKKLSPEDLVIADQQGALALAGVMGGKKSAVTEKTTNLFLEVANFQAATIRRTKQRHDLPTDAAYRFERGLDPNGVGDALREAAALLLSLSSGKISGFRDVYPKKKLSHKIALSLKRVEQVLGVELPLFEVVQHLALLGLKVKKIANEKTLAVTVPTRRPDLQDEWDLIEEIGRMYGYDRIHAVAPVLPLTAAPANHEKHFERTVKEYLASSGFDEVMTYSFYGVREREAAHLQSLRHLEIENPLSPEQCYLRRSLLPLQLRKAKENMRFVDTFHVFEWGRVYAYEQKTDRPIEETYLALVSVLSKKSAPGETFFALKGKLEALFQMLKMGEYIVEFVPLSESTSFSETALLHPTRSAEILIAGKRVGLIGEVHPQIAKAFGIEVPIAVAELSARDLQKHQDQERSFVSLQKFPYALRDISLTFPKTTTYNQVEQILLEAGAPLLKQYSLLNIYEKDGERSFAFHLSFGVEERTLSSAEMDAAFDRIVTLATERGGRLRL